MTGIINNQSNIGISNPTIVGNIIAESVMKVVVKALNMYCPPSEYAKARALLEKDLLEFLENCGYLEVEIDSLRKAQEK